MSLTLARLADKARRDRKAAFTSIAHLVDVDLLRASHRRLRKDASAGPDGMTCVDGGWIPSKFDGRPLPEKSGGRCPPHC